MAIQISFEGFVNEIKTFSWGTVAVVAHARRGKNAQGEWETVGKDYVDVVLPEGASVDENNLVAVTGTATFGAYVSKAGDAKPTIKVNASSIELVDRVARADSAQAPAARPATAWAPVTEEAPF